MAVCDMAIRVKRSRIDAVAEAVRGLGLSVERVLPAIGAIYARGDMAAIDLVRAVDGVEAVREAGTVQLAPPRTGLPQ